MRAAFALAVWLPLLASAPAAAQGEAASSTTDAEAADPHTLAARSHFKLGIKLYRDANYGGALAEFEAAYQSKPSPGPLQNVALCQKAMFRYGEAADSLRLLLAKHSAELSEHEAHAVKLAIAELDALVGTIRVRVFPEGARVLLDGKPLSAAERALPLRVNVGEHNLSAEADGYAPQTRTFRVAGGQKDVPAELTLTPIAGFVAIRANDPRAVIAIDGKPLSRGSYGGPIGANEEHFVQIYRPGYEPFETYVTAAVGETTSVTGTLGPALDDETPEPAEDPLSPGALPPAPEARKPRGFYGLVALNLLGTSATPFDFDLTNTRASSGAASLGLRVGNRLIPTLRVEGLFEFGALNVDGACDKARTLAIATRCGDDDQVERSYALTWVRFGPNLRLTTSGERLRFGFGAGAGLVWHRLRLRAEQAQGSGVELPPGESAGVDPYFLIELGAEYGFKRILMGVDVFALVDGARGLSKSFEGESKQAFETSGKTVPMVGIGLRFGLTQWITPK
jgi:hypothetical protein